MRANSPLAVLVLAATLACSQPPPAEVSYPYAYAKSEGPTLTEAIDFHRGQVEENPKNYKEWAALAQVYVSQAQWSHDPAYYELAREAAQRSQELLANPSATVALAAVAQAEHQFEQALALCEKVRARDATHGDALSLSITCLLELGRPQEARTLLDRFKRHHSGPAVLSLEGRLLEATGRFEPAAQAFQSAILQEQAGERRLSVKLRVQLGRVFWRLGRPEEARAALESALAISANDPFALTTLGLVELSQERPEAAISLFTRAFAATQEAEALVYLARAHHQKGNQQEAERVWSQAETLLEGDLKSGHYGHGRQLVELYLDRGRPEDIPKAMTVLEQELALRRDPLTLTVAAQTYWAAGLPEKARELVEEATRSGFHSAQLSELKTSLPK